jgi:xanthine dehydrogenase YagR molybdenum-binding subunit
MTASIATKLVGEPVDRVDGPAKVTGAAAYPSDVTLPGMAHAALVQSTIAAGTISNIDAAPAEAAPGVLAVITHQNAPTLADGPMTPLGPTPPLPLRDNRILHHGQHVAMVVAETQEQAAAAVRLVEIEYRETAPVLGIRDPTAPVSRDPWGSEVQRGDVAAALDSAEVVYDETFTIAAETNSPLGLFATVAHWEGQRPRGRECRAHHHGDGRRVRLPERGDARPAGAAQHSEPRLDARPRHGRRQFRTRVGPGRALVRAAHRPDPAAVAQLR